MKKSNSKYFIFAMMMSLTAFGWSGALKNGSANDMKYREYVEKAREHEQKEAYITAADNYIKALEIKPSDTELMISTAENYMKCGDRNGFLKYCNMAAESSPEKDKPYLLLAEYYHSSGEIKKASEILSSAPDGENAGEIASLLNKLKYEYRKSYRCFADTKGFYGEYCAVCDDTGKWGLADKKGDMEIVMQYDSVGAYNADEDIVPVCDNGKWYFTDIMNRKKYAPDSDYSYLGTYSCGLAPFEYGGKYGYMTLDYDEAVYGYEFAGAFSEGVVAVKKDGKWALINDSLEEVTGFVYDEIKVDGYGFCTKNGKIHAVADGRDVVLGTDGNEADEITEYICGLAPFNEDGRYGYADEYGEAVIEPIFEDVLPFSPSGASCVKENGMWEIIWLCCME